MLTKNPDAPGVTEADAVKRIPIREAFREFGIDPSTPGARDKLLQAMAERLFAKRALGRRRGSLKLNAKWYRQLEDDGVAIYEEQGWPLAGKKASASKMARLLQAKFPSRYGKPTTDTGWLRQRLFPRHLRRLSQKDYDQLTTAAGLTPADLDKLRRIFRAHMEIVEADRHDYRRWSARQWRACLDRRISLFLFLDPDFWRDIFAEAKKREAGKLKD